MLESIITSKTKRDVLLLLFSNPDKEFYVRQICRDIDQQPNLVRAELLKLETAGLINSRTSGNVKYYSPNKDSQIYRELSQIITKAGLMASTIRNTLTKHKKKIRYAFVYGSFARGEQKENSDIDLLIIGNPNQIIMAREINDIEKRIRREINYTVYSEEEFIEKKNTGFIKRVLEDKKIMLIGEENELK